MTCEASSELIRVRCCADVPTGVAASACALLGVVGLTTAAGVDLYTSEMFFAGEIIYGPFENGKMHSALFSRIFLSQVLSLPLETNQGLFHPPPLFSPTARLFEGFDGSSSAVQRSILQGLGCSAVKAASLVVPGGIDTATAEAMMALACGVELPRVDAATGSWIGLVDSCGGHSSAYHFHERLSCLYAQDPGTGHSAQVGAARWDCRSPCCLAPLPHALPLSLPPPFQTVDVHPPPHFPP